MKRAVTAASRVFGLIVLVLAAGCGGGDDRLSREEFVSEAEQVCDDFDQRVNEVDEPQNADDVERYVNEVRPVVEDGLNDLRGLQPPEEFEEQWDELMAANDAGLEALDDLAQAGANGTRLAYRKSLRTPPGGTRKATASRWSSAWRNALAEA
jgi:hypothetical protein